jgi:proteasome beta subunit
MSEDKFISTGSGSQVAYGILEDRYKDSLTVKDGIELSIRCVKAAIERDLATGDGISIATITKDGYREFSDKEIEAVM